jgi:8-oxo-dGTP pyrophosphatase MutT (NUDIX family)
MVGASILPVSIRNGKLYFLFGKENSMDKTQGFSDFGGGVEEGETHYETALREGAEELTGFLGSKTELKKLIQKNGGHLKLSYKFPQNAKNEKNSYNIHLFFLEYDENLPKYYNQNHKFLWEKMDEKLLSRTKLFEKIEIEWFCIEDMKKRRKEFRCFYRDIVDVLIENKENIWNRFSHKS